MCFLLTLELPIPLVEKFKIFLFCYFHFSLSIAAFAACFACKIGACANVFESKIFGKKLDVENKSTCKIPHFCWIPWKVEKPSVSKSTVYRMAEEFTECCVKNALTFCVTHNCRMQHCKEFLGAMPQKSQDRRFQRMHFLHWSVFQLQSHEATAPMNFQGKYKQRQYGTWVANWKWYKTKMLVFFLLLFGCSLPSLSHSPDLNEANILTWQCVQFGFQRMACSTVNATTYKAGTSIGFDISHCLVKDDHLEKMTPQCQQVSWPALVFGSDFVLQFCFFLRLRRVEES